MQLILIALQQAIGRPIRTVLSIVTLTLAVTALIAVTAASNAVTEVVRQSAIQQGGRPTTVLASGLAGTVGLEQGAQLSEQLRRAQPASTIARVARLESVVLDHHGVATPLEVQFVDPDVQEIYQYVVTDGSWLAESRESLSVRAVINDAAANQLRMGIGSTFALRVPGHSTTTTATVTGTVQDSAPDARVFVEIENAKALLRANSRTLTVQLVMAGDNVTATDVGVRLAGLGANFPSTALETQRTDTVDRLTSQVDATASAFALVGMFSLIGGVVGLANIGLAGVREQAAELSVRRAFGARWWHLPLITVLETQFIAVVASGFAVLVSRAVYPTLAAQLGSAYGLAAVPFPWDVAGLGLAAGVVAAAAASLAPAIRSLSVPIASVMRAE